MIDVENIPAIAMLERKAREIIANHARIADAPPDTVFFQPGSQCSNYLIVIDGSVRVSVTGRSGREIVLYRVEAGQTCVITTSCLLGGGEYDAEGRAETTVRALVLPRTAFSQLLETSSKFRQFAFQSFSDRMKDLIVLINEIAFGQLDIRLARWLHTNANDDRIATTHNEIAVELGSAREAVSRLLKEFENHGWLQLDRGLIVTRSLQDISRYSEK